MGSFRNQNILLLIFILIATALPYYFYSKKIFPFDSPIIYAASMVTSIVFIIGFMLFLNLSRRTAKLGGGQVLVPKLLIDNSNVKTVSFLDATGAHAGALLGDCLHDPLQCFFTTTEIQTFKRNLNQKGEQVTPEQVNIKKEVDSILENKKDSEIIKEGTYQAAFLEKGKLKIVAEKENTVAEAEVLSVNRSHKDEELIKITTESGKELLVTPEHKVAIRTFFNKIRYIRADQLRQWHQLITLG